MQRWNTLQRDHSTGSQGKPQASGCQSSPATPRVDAELGLESLAFLGKGSLGANSWSEEIAHAHEKKPASKATSRLEPTPGVRKSLMRMGTSLQASRGADFIVSQASTRLGRTASAANTYLEGRTRPLAPPGARACPAGRIPCVRLLGRHGSPAHDNELSRVAAQAAADVRAGASSSTSNSAQKSFRNFPPGSCCRRASQNLVHRAWYSSAMVALVALVFLPRCG